MSPYYFTFFSAELTKRIHITRLPPGHTHEDIDAKFAVIWVNNRCQYILTPQEQKEESINAFGIANEQFAVDMVDVFAVPDYKKYFKGFTQVYTTTKPFLFMYVLFTTDNTYMCLFIIY